MTGAFLGFLTAVTLILFLISLTAARRSRDHRAVVLCLILSLFAVKNIIISVLYFRDEAPDFTLIMFADAFVTLGILVRMAWK